jgi:outer membrane protein assembly factor BamA
MQQDLKTIFRLGYFTERMKAIPVKNENGTISLKIILEENIPVTDFTIEGNTVVSSEELMQHFKSIELIECVERNIKRCKDAETIEYLKFELERMKNMQA